MSIKSNLSAAALLTVVAISGMASPAFAAPKAPKFCHENIMQIGCGSIVTPVNESRSRYTRIPVTHLDTREQAMSTAGGGGSGGGGGAAVAKRC